MRAMMMAVVAKGERGRLYLSASDEMEMKAKCVRDYPLVKDARETFLSEPTPERLTGGTCYGYGLTTWGSLFTDRQLVALTTFSNLVQEVREKVLADAKAADIGSNDQRLADCGAPLGAQLGKFDCVGQLE